MFNDLMSEKKNLNMGLQWIPGEMIGKKKLCFQEWQKFHTQLLASEACIFATLTSNLFLFLSNIS